MGNRNTLSGHIQEPWYIPGSAREIARLWHYNRRVLRSLPVNEPWPLLIRRMFSWSPMIQSGRAGFLTSTYRGPVIYFGGSFSSLYTDWPEWLEKFESLLRHLYWEHAVVVLVTEFFGPKQWLYRWDAEGADFTAERPEPIRVWQFSGGPRDFGSQSGVAR